MNIIDTHTHLFLEEFDDDRADAVNRAKAVGVSRCYLPNIDSTTVNRMLLMCKEYEGYCYPLIGVHPSSITTDNYKEELQFVEEWLQRPHGFVGIGEIGIDLYWDTTYRKEQQKVFEQQVEWAVRYDMPIVIHCRSAFNDVYDILKSYSQSRLRGIFHSFTGEAEMVGRVIEFPEFKLGINGVVTFKKSVLPDVLKDIPLDRIVLETDSPYLAPVPNRGKRNESAFIEHTLAKVAEIYKSSVEEVAAQTTANALSIFGQ